MYSRSTLRPLALTAVLFSLLGSLGGCGDGAPPGAVCGAGTVLEDGECVGAGPVCGDGTTLTNGVCVATPDTTTCGPGTVLQADVCVVDTTAPGPVADLAAVITGANIDLSWTAGAGATGTLVARLVAGAHDAPAAFTSYAVGDTLPGGAEVVGVGAVTAGVDAFTTPGRYSYMAWSKNASGNYGFGREVSLVVPVPAQRATLTVDVAAATAVFAAQPAHVPLAASNVVFDAVTGTVTFDLQATNNTAGALFNTKAILGTPSEGAVANATGLTATNAPFVTLGFAALVPGDAVNSEVALSGVLATSTVTLEVEIVESGLGILGANAIDAAGGTSMTLELPSIRGSRQVSSVFSDGFLGASGRYFYGLTRWTTGLFRIDTSSGDVRAFSPVTVGTGNGACVMRGDDGFAYAVYALGSHRQRDANGIAIAKIDLASMIAVATTELYVADADVKGCALHGTTLAVAHGTDVFLANAATMQFVDQDLVTADVIDPIAVGTTEPLRTLVFANDGTRLFATAQYRDSAIYQLDLATLAVTTYHTASSDRVFSLTVDAAGTLWWGGPGGLFSFDGTTEATVPNFTSEVRAIAAIAGTRATVATTEDTLVVDVTTGAVTAVGDLDQTSRMGHNFALFATP